jgi:hypothetical protein
VNAGQILAVGLSLALALWFATGTWYNRRRARRIWGWLEDGLKVFGGRPNQVWMGASGAGLRVTVEKPAAPFRRIELLVQLESRENLPLWLFERARGKRDRLVVVGTLRSPGRGEIRVVPAGGAPDWEAAADDDWKHTKLTSRWSVVWRGEVEEEQFEALRAFVDTYGAPLQHISYQRPKPHLFVAMGLESLEAQPSQRLLGQVKALVAH